MREIARFTLVSQEFFETLSSYSIQPTYFDHLKTLLPEEWSLERDRTYLFAHSAETDFPDQGFKIHVSGTPSNAEELLSAVVPHCVKEKTAFKIAADPFLLTFTCSKSEARGSSGKFITIYPRDESVFRRLIDALHGVTSHLAGPYILSDRRYADSKVLFYRYGGFRNRQMPTVDGQNKMAILAPDGTLELDERTPYFKLPAWVDDPFGGSKSIAGQDSDLLNDRYRIQEALTFSNSGGVYKATDTRTGATVILKEARPLTAYWRNTDGFIDAVQMLEREYAVLKRLEHLDFVVKALDLFSAWEHRFLVEEYVEGTPLTRFRASDAFTLAPFTGEPARVASFCKQFRSLALRLLDAVQDIHRANILIGDLSPNNVIVNPETLDFRLIDFESGTELKESGETDWLSRSWATPGFRSPERAQRKRLTREDDYYALGMLLYSTMVPIQNLFELAPAAKEPFLDRIERATGLPAQAADTIRALLEGHADRARCILEGWDVAAISVLGPALGATGLEDLEVNPIWDEMRATTDGIAQYLSNTYDVARQDRLWPADYSVFLTNPYSVAYGACGTILGLLDLTGETPPDVKRWLLDRRLDGSLPPGLYMGGAGIAWTLAELGEIGRACDTMRQAYESPLLYKEAGLLWGAAGTGLASLQLFQKTGDRCFVAKAAEIGDHLISTAEDRPEGCCWRNTMDNLIHLSAGYGGSGVALFLLNLHAISGEDRFLDYARRAIGFEAANGRAVDDHMIWGRFEGDLMQEPYWLHGGSGVGAVLLRFYRILGEPHYLELARKAAAGTFCRITVQPAQFEGLSGIAEFMLDMYWTTGESKYREQAVDAARTILCYRIEKEQGYAYPGRHLMRVSNDFGYGAAGVGAFLHRLQNPGPRRFHDLV